MSLVVALIALNFVYFYCFHVLRREVVIVIGEASVNKTVVDLIAGYLAGVVAVLITGPLWLGKKTILSFYTLVCDAPNMYNSL